MKKTIQFGVILLLGGILFRFFFVPSGFYSTQKPSFQVRVRLVHDVDRARLGSKKNVEIFDTKTGETLSENVVVRRGGVNIVLSDNGIKIGEKTYGTDQLRVVPLRRKGLELNGTLYRGSIDIAKTRDGFDVVNTVGLEDYLRGVLPCEVNHFWPLAVLKAQAVASRSFAAYKVSRRKNKSYDLTADTFSQVYGGWSSEKWRTNRAVEVTKGKVLAYEEEVIPAYFHSCCGGHTQDASRVWGSEVRPLRGVKCEWCRWSPYFRWQVRLPAGAIMEGLNENGYSLRRLDNMIVGPRDDSGRLEYVRVKSRNKWFEIPVADFRHAVGTRFLKSSNFRIKKYPLFYLFSGYGWGHGVGMCQWGAFGLAFRWWNAEKILWYYYPDTEIVDLKSIVSGE